MLLAERADDEAAAIAGRAAALSVAADTPVQRALADFLTARARHARDPAAARAQIEAVRATLRELGVGYWLLEVDAWLAAHPA